MPNSKSTLSINEAATILGVSNKTLRRWEQAGKLVPLRTQGGHRRYTTEQIISYKKQKKSKAQTTTATSPLVQNSIPTNPVSITSSNTIQHKVEEEVQDHIQNLTAVVSNTAPNYISSSNAVNMNQDSVKPAENEMLESETNMTAPLYEMHLHNRQKSFLRKYSSFFIISSLILVTLKLVTLTTTRTLFADGFDTIANSTSLKPLHQIAAIVRPTDVSLAANTLDSNVLALATTSLEDQSFNVYVDTNLRNDVVVNGTLEVSSGELTTDSDVFTFVNENALTLNIGGAATEINVGADTGDTTINNNLTVNDNLTVTGTTNDIAGVLNLSGNSLTTTADLLIDPGGGGVTIGTGTPGNVDLAGDDLFVSGDLEVNGNAYLSTLVIGGDSLTELAGTGLQVSGGELQTVLGSTIETGEIADGTILAVDFDSTNDPTDDYILSYDSGTGGFTWVVDSTGSSVFTNTGTLVHLTTTTDNVTIGSTTELSKFAVDGDTDEIQLLVQGNSTQTSNLAVLEQSDGTDVLTVGNTGTTALTNSGSGDITFNLTSTGDFVIQDAGSPFATFTDGGIFTLDNLSFDGNTLSSTSGNIVLTPSGSLVFTGLDCTGNSNGGALTADASGVITCSNDDGGAGGYTNWILDGDSGTPQAIDSSNTATITGGTGITTTVGATDELTIDFDSTELGNLTWGDSSNATLALTTALSGATDPVLTFGNNSVTLANAGTLSSTSTTAFNLGAATIDFNGAGALQYANGSNFTLADDGGNNIFALTGASDLIQFGNATDNNAFTFLGSGQTTFNGNVDVTSGLDVTGASLTVGGNATITTAGVATLASTLSVEGLTIGLNNDADANNLLGFGSGTAGTASGDLYWGDDLVCDVSASNCGYVIAGGSGSSKWTDSGTTVYLTDTTDELVLGGSSPLSSAKFSIDGDADQIQLIIQGSGSQTASLVALEQSDGNNVLDVTAYGDVIAGFDQLDGSTTTNGTGSSSTTMILTDGTSFDVGNYIQVSSTNCSAGVNTCYAKIRTKNTNTITIAPALTWANGSTVNEYHVPEIGATNLADTLANRYGRGYFISGVSVGNSSTYYEDGNIQTADITGGNSQNFTFTTGDTTTSGNSGDITIDTGSAAGTAGTINIGTSNTSGITIGRSGISTSIAGDLDLTSTTVDIELNDNTANTLTISEGTNNYIDIDTNDGAEALSFGNATTSPDYAFLGTGSFTISSLTTDGVVITSSGALSSESQLALSRGGTGASLSDPNADRIFFWDDGAGSTAFLAPDGTSIEISGTTLQHVDTSSQASVNNSGTTVIQDVTLDTYGHITGLASLDLSSSFDNYTSWTFAVDGVNQDAITSGDVLDFVSGNGITVTRSLDDQLTFTAADISATNELQNLWRDFTADSGSATANSQTDSFAISGGTNGIDTAISGDAVTLNLDTTEIASTTFGTGSGFTWTFDAGVTDPSFDFADDDLDINVTLTTFSGTIAVQGTSIGLNNDADSNNILSFDTPSASTASGDLYWGDDLVCDVSAANCGYVTSGGSGSSKWSVNTTPTPDVTYLTETTFDLAVGGNDAEAPLFVDVSGSALNLNPYGIAAGNTGEIRFQELEATGDNYTGFKAPDALAGDVIYTLPDADGSSNQVLATDSSGNLSWIDVSAGSGGYTGWTLSDGTTSQSIASGNTVTTADSSTINATVSATDTLTYNVIADSLNFTEFSDSLTLDAATTITNSLAGNLEVDLTSTGDFVISDAGVAFFTFTDGGALTQAGSGQVTLSGNVDATSGLDVTGASLTVGGNATITTAGAGTFASTLTANGTFDANGIVTIGDGGDTIAIDGDTWDITSTGVGSGFTSLTVDSLLIDGTTIGLSADSDLLSFGSAALTVNGTGTFTGDLATQGTTLGLNNDLDSNNVFSFNAATASTASGDLYWGDDLLCDVSATNCGWATSGTAFTQFTVAGDSGGGQTITDSNTLTIAGGTNGIDTVDSITDTVTINLDTTEIASTTFGAGSGYTWTFDAGTTDPSFDFANDDLDVNVALTTFSGAIAVEGNSIALNNDADTDNVLGFSASVGSAGSDLYWGDDLLCDVSESNCGWTTAASSFSSWSVADDDGDTYAIADSNILRFTSSDSNVLTNLTNGDDADENLDLSIRLLGDAVAGSGLTGGANDVLVGADGDTTFDIGAGNGITVNADDVAVNEDYNFTLTGDVTFTPAGTDNLDFNLDSDSLLTIDQAFSGTTTANSVTLTGTNSSTSGTQNLLYLDNAASTGTTDSLLVLDNSDLDTAVTNAIEFVDAGGGFTNLFNVGGTLISSSEFTVLDNGIALGSEVTGTLPLANGGTGASLSDPNADSIFFWDDGAGSSAWLTPDGTSIEISGTTLQHVDTSTQASVDNSGTTFIQDITLDTYGHLIGITSADLSGSFDNYASWTLAGDTGSSQTISSGNTASIVGGTNGIDTVASATDTLTLNLDTTEIGATTFGAGSGFTWTFDAGATDPVINFASDQLNLGSATTGLRITSAGLLSDIDGNVVIGDTVDLGSATTGIRVATTGSLSDIDGNFVVADTVDLGSATTGIRVATTGSLLDIDGNLILNDTVDLGSATTGVNVTTAGVLSDIDGNLVLGDTLDLGSATTGINVTTAGVLSDIDGNLVLGDTVDLGSATTGLRVTTAGAISDIDGDISLNDNTSITGTLSVSGDTIGLNNDADSNNILSFNAPSVATASGDLYWGDDLLCDVSATNCGWSTGSSTPDFDEVYAQSITNANLTMEIDSTTGLTYDLTTTGDFVIADAGSPFATFTNAGVFTLDSLNLDGTTIGLTTDTDLLSLASGALTVNGTATAADLTLGLNDTSATIATQDTDEDLTINPNGAGDIYFHGSTYNLSDTGDFTLGGRVTFENSEYISNETNDQLIFGLGGAAELNLSTTALSPSTAEGLGLGSATNEWESLYLGDDAGVSFGLDQDWTFAYDEATDDRLELVTSGTSGFMLSSGVTTGTGSFYEFDSLTSGTGFLAEYAPASAGTLSGDLFRLNIGANGTVTGNIFSIADNGTNLFSVNQAKITSALPHEFTAAGDVSVAYDLVFTNQTAGKIESYGPLTVQSGESFENNDLTLRTYGTGSVIVEQDLYVGEFTSSGTAALCWDNSGGSYINDCSGSPVADYAEIYPTQSGTEFGDLVALGNETATIDFVSTDEHGNPEAGVERTVNKLKKATASDRSKLIGITSRNYSDFTSTGHNVVNAADKPMPIALTGRVPVKVSSQNGTILAGDPITVSSIPGVAAKANSTGMIVGTALESYQEADPNTTGEILVFVNPMWYQAETLLSLNGSGDVLLKDGSGDTLLAGNETNLSVSSQNISLNGSTTINSQADTLLAAASNGETVFAIDNSGNAEVGLEAITETDPLLSGNVCYEQVDDQGTPRYKLVQCDEGGADLAEYYPVNHTDEELIPQAGDIVKVGDPLGTSNQFVVEKTNEAYDSKAIGVVSTKAHTIMGEDILEWAEKAVPVALAGRVPVKIDPNSAPIAAGDRVTTSPAAGRAMKATITGYTIGNALEAWTPDSGKDTILVFVESSVYLDQQNKQALENLASEDVTIDSIEALLATIENDQTMIKQALGWEGLEDAAGDINVSTLSTEQLYVTDIAAIENLSLGSSLVLGNDFVISSISNDEGTLLGTAIETLDAPLSIQGTGRQPLSIMAGKVTIDTNGNVAIAGDVTIEGDLAAQSITTDKLVLSSSDDKTQTENAQEESPTDAPNTSIGTGTLIAGETSVEIETSAVTENSLIYLTPTSSTLNKVLYLKGKVVCENQPDDNQLPTAGTCTPGFVAGIDGVTTQDIQFNWWIVDSVSTTNN